MTVPRRAYRHAAVRTDRADAGGGASHSVLLDDRPVRTPARRDLAVPSLDLAEAIAAEWNAQTETIDPAAMPLTRLACTVVDRVNPDPSAIVLELRQYGETDLLCYHAQRPATLVDRQEAQWQPVLDWLDRDLGIGLVVTQGILPAAQPKAALDRLAAHVETIEPFALGGLVLAARATGSVGLALAMLRGRLDAQAAWQASLVDETFQSEQWGTDAEAEAAQHAVLDELRDIERYLRLLGHGSPET